MANNIALIEKYLGNVIDTVYAEDAKTAILDNGGKYIDLNFKEAGYVRVMSLLMDGLSDYYRVNHIGVAGTDAYSHDNGNNLTGARDGYKRGSVKAEWEIFKLRYDRGVQFVVDAMDDEETAGQVIANLLTEFMRTKAVPEKDAIVLSTIAGKCNATLGNLITENVATLGNTIIAKFNTAFEWLTEHEVPAADQVIFVSPRVMTEIRNTTEINRYITQADYTTEKGITFTLPAYDGRPIIVVPSDRFFTNIVVGDNGYRPAANGKVINYLICDKKGVVPVVKLQKSKVWTPDTQDDIDGYKVNVRMYHDCIVPKNKILGCFCSVSDVVATTKTAKVDVALVEGTTQNGYVVENAFTTPAGLLGTLVRAATAFTLGATVEVDENDIKTTIVGEEIVEAVATKSYFALVDATGKVLATSGEITLPKKA